MNPSRLVVVGLASAAIATVPASQSASPFVEVKTIDSPTATHSSAKARVVAGDLNGDLDVDLLYSDDGDLLMMFAPGKTNAIVDLERSAIDFDLLPPDGPGEASQIVVVTGDGIVLLSDYDAGSFSASPRPSALWDGAQRVRVTDLADNGTYDLIGVHADGETIVRADGIRDASPVFSSFDVGGPILDLAVADWTGTSAREVLVLTGDGLLVFDAGGTQLDSVAFSASKGFVAAMRQTGYGYARAVLVYRTGTTRYLRVADASGIETAEALPGLAIVAIGITDADDDGDGDLVLIPSFATDAYYLDNESDGDPPGSGPTYVVASSDPLELGPFDRFQSAGSGLRDFDNDGDPDLLQYVSALDAFVYCTNTTVDPSSQLVSFDTLPGGELDGSVLLDATGPGEIQLELDLSVTVPAKPYVEVTVWSQPAGPGLTAACDPVPVFQGVFAVAGGTADLHLPLGDLTPGLDTVFNLELRGVDFANGDVLDPGPTAFAAFGLPSDVTDEMELLYGTGFVGAEVLLDAGSGPAPFFGDLNGRELTPVVTCTPNTPPFDLPPSPTKPPMMM